MFMGYPIDQWQGVIVYTIFVLILFAGICLASVKLNNYYIKEENKRKRLNKLKNKYRNIEKNNLKRVA